MLLVDMNIFRLKGKVTAWLERVHQECVKAIARCNCESNFDNLAGVQYTLSLVCNIHCSPSLTNEVFRILQPLNEL